MRGGPPDESPRVQRIHIKPNDLIPQFYHSDYGAGIYPDASVICGLEIKSPYLPSLRLYSPIIRQT